MCSTIIPNQLVEIYSVLAERIGETLSGESAPFSISVIGSDLDADDRVGAQIVEVLQHLPGSGNVRLTVPPREVELHVELLPEQLAIYGLQAADVLQTVNAAYHGTRGGANSIRPIAACRWRCASRAPAPIPAAVGALAAARARTAR